MIDRIRDTVSGIAPETINRRPPDGGWSIAEVLEHLIVSADSYLTRMRPLIHASGTRVDANAMWKPTAQIERVKAKTLGGEHR